jgi:hypothetical protein
MPLEDIANPVCVPADVTDSSSVGTAPGVQPTATPLPGQRDAETVKSEIDAYLDAVAPAFEHARYWETWLRGRWAESLSSGQQATALHIASIRMAQACNALAAMSYVPQEAASSHIEISEAARRRLAWSQDAVAQLQCCGTGITHETEADALEVESAFDEAYATLSSLIEEFPDVSPGRYELFDPVLAVRLRVPDGWFTWPEGLSIVLTAPAEENDDTLAGLGADSWRLGTSVRVRRLRNSNSLTVAEANDQFQALVTRQGEVLSSREISIDKAPALMHTLNAGGGWNVTMTIVTAGEFVYFIETGCSTNVPAGCDQAMEIVDSVRFSAS